jgi:hypothetical protein
MVELAVSLAAWLLGFQIPHPGSFYRRGWPNAVLKGSIPVHRMAKKLNTKLNDNILVFYIL